MANILKVLKGPLSTLGKKNRNGRIYSKELWENVLHSEYWQDMIKNNSLCGEVVHPGERTESDPFEIDVRNISHRVTEAHIEGDKLIGTVEVLDTEQGRNLLSLIDSGCTVGISARGMGDLDGDTVVPDTYNFKCFDITMRPSDPNARLVPLTESEKVKLIIKESECTDEFLEGSVPYTKQDRTKTDVMNNILKELKSNNTDDRLDFKLSNRGIKVTLDGEKFGDVFAVNGKSDDNNWQIDKYKVFTNKDKDFGYEEIPSRGEFSNTEYTRIAKKLLSSFKKKVTPKKGNDEK